MFVQVELLSQWTLQQSIKAANDWIHHLEVV